MMGSDIMVFERSCLGSDAGSEEIKSSFRALQQTLVPAPLGFSSSLRQVKIIRSV